MSAAKGGGQLVTSEGGIATYRYCKLGFAPVATPTDWLIIQGSATRTCRIKFIKFTGVATANGTMPVQLIRRSTAGTPGSAILTAIPAALHDIGDATNPADPAATATVSTVGTANYTTVGTQNPTNGVLCVDRLSLATTATGLPTEQVRWDFAYHEDKSLYLRGASDFICINGAGAAVPAGAAIDVEIEIEEGTF